MALRNAMTYLLSMVTFVFVSFAQVHIICHLQEFFFFTDDLDERRLKRGPYSEGDKLIINAIKQNSFLSFTMTNVSDRY